MPQCFGVCCPESERLSEERLVSDLRSRGQRARYIREVDAIVHTIAAERREGDIVVLMSNGGFGGIHQKLLARPQRRGLTGGAL